MLQFLNDVLSQIELEPWWQVVKVLAVSVALALLVRWLLSRVAARLAGRTRTGFDDKVLHDIKNPVSVSVMLFGVNLAMVLAGLPDVYQRYVLAALKTAAVLIWVVFFSRLAKLLLETVSRNRERFRFVQPQTLPAFSNLTTTVILGAAIYFLLLAWNVDVSAWVASAGILGLAASLAARDSLANLFAGLSILADAPFKVGDYIVLESGERGEVQHIGLRSSRVMTRDDIEIIVPNSVLANTKIINEAGGPHPRHRVRVKVQVAYGTDMDQVRRVLLEAAAGEPQICREPEPRVRFRSFEDSGLAVELLAWVPEPWMRGRMLDALNTQVYERFAEEGVEIPFPRRVVTFANPADAEVPRPAEESSQVR